MDEKEFKPDQTQGTIEEPQDSLDEKEVYEALSEMKVQKRSEQILMGLIVAGVFTALVFGYNIWQRTAVASQYQPSPIGTSAAYSESSSSALGGGGGGCCGVSGSVGAATTGAEAAALAGSSSSGCGSSGGGCGSGGSGAALGADEQKQLETTALSYYAQTYGDDQVTVKVQSFGCHMECYFYKDGQLVKSLIYRGGQFLEK